MPPSPYLASLTLTLVGALSLSATADDAMPDYALPSVTVTAKGYAADELDTPKATLRLDPASIAVSQSVGNLFRGQPGTAVHSDGAWGLNPVLRGLKKESIVLQVDGVRVNSAQPTGALASFASLGLLDSVEVVKGPGSVLHGSGALGGAVNLRTPDAEFSDTASLQGRFATGAGSVDESLGGGVMLQLANPDHALVLGGTAREVNDYDTPEGRVKNSGFQSGAFLLKYAFRLADDHRLTLNVQGQEDRDVWYPGSAKLAPSPRLGTLTIHSPRQQRELYEVGYTGDLGPGTLQASLYRQEVFRQIRGYSSGLDRNQVWNDVTFTTDGGRVQYRLPLGERHLLTTGVEAWEMSGDPKRFSYRGPTSNVVANSPFRNGSLESRGLFVQDEIMFDDWTLLAGARYDSVTGDADIKGSGPNATREGLENTSDSVSWSLGAIYNVTPLLNPYVSLGSAYRAADMRERFEDAARGDGYFHTGNPQLDPERSTSLEVGLKGRSERGEYHLAAFHTRIDDYIAGRVTGQMHPQQGVPIKRTENLDRVTIHGVEGGFTMPLDVSLAGGHWQLGGSLTWLRGTNKQDDEPLYEMPAPEATLGIGQQPPTGFNWHAQVRGVMRQDRTADIFSGGNEQETPGYATADLSLGWRFKNTTLEAGLDIHNLFDRGYREHLTDQPVGDALLAPGINVMATLRGRF
ncbi:MAG TPA: TonB-dependent receptor [Halomonas sp.]|nr:TonB-dependent receptor [Halomonas sp.]